MPMRHSVVMDHKRCRGCTSCIKCCPTEAIRVRGRKAAYETFRPRHKMATLEEEYQQNLDYYGEIARLFPELGATPQDVETAALEKVYQARHTYELFEDSIPTLEALRGKYKLGVISDTWPSIVPVLEEFGLPGYFGTLTYSFEVGCFKPDHRMYEDKQRSGRS